MWKQQWSIWGKFKLFSRNKNGLEINFLTKIKKKYLKNKDYSPRRDNLTPYTRVANKDESWRNSKRSTLYSNSSQIFTWFSEKNDHFPKYCLHVCFGDEICTGIFLHNMLLIWMYLKYYCYNIYYKLLGIVVYFWHFQIVYYN